MHLIQDTVEGFIVTLSALFFSDVVTGRTHLHLKT